MPFSYPELRLFLSKGTRLWLILLAFLAGATPATAQEPSARAWAERLEQSVLVLVYPSYSVKHERVAQALQDLPTEHKARQRAERQMELDEASRDTLLIALAQSFQAFYRLSEVYFMADTTYHRHWKQGDRVVSLLSADQLNPTTRQWDPARILILRQQAGDRETGTGITLWTLETGDSSPYPSKFPATFSDGGSLGNRFLQFFHAMFRSGNRPDRLAEVLPATDHLARQVQKKWGRYLGRLGFGN